MVGTTRRPFASRPITAGGPPPDANTRSKPRSSSRAARRKSSTTLTIPRRITTSRISSATHASICSSLWSARRARYSVGSADRPVEATVPPASVGRRKYARPLRSRGTEASRGGQGGVARTFGPLVEPLCQPPTDPPGPLDVGCVCDERGESGGQTIRRVGQRRAVRSPLEGDRLPDRDGDAAPEAEPARAVDGDRYQGHARAHREIGGTLAERQDLVLASVDPAFACDRDDSPAGDHRANLPRRLEEVVLAGLVRDRRPGPGHDAVPAAHGHVLLLRAEEPQPWSVRQERHQDERVRPAHVVEAVDGRTRRQRWAIGATDPEVPAGQDGDDEPRDPIAQGPPPRPDVGAGKGASCWLRHGTYVIARGS